MVVEKNTWHLIASFFLSSRKRNWFFRYSHWACSPNFHLSQIPMVVDDTTKIDGELADVIRDLIDQRFVRNEERDSVMVSEPAFTVDTS